MPDDQVSTIRRLNQSDVLVARETFQVMTAVFGEAEHALDDAYIASLLARPDFWVMCAAVDGRVVGGITAHVLPMTRSQESELFIYDLAVATAWQRRGIGRSLVSNLRQSAARAGIDTTFVPADNDDQHALDFYREIGGAESPVTFFVFDS